MVSGEALGLPNFPDLADELRTKIREDGRYLHAMATVLWHKDSYTEPQFRQKFKDVWLCYERNSSEVALFYLLPHLASGGREIGYPVTVGDWIEEIATEENGLAPVIEGAFLAEVEDSYQAACDEAEGIIPRVTDYFPGRLPEGDAYEKSWAALFGRMLTIYRGARSEYGPDGDLVTECWGQMPESLRNSGQYAYVTEFCRCFNLPMPRTGLHDGEYTLETLVGVGGMSAVYRAMHRDIPRRARRGGNSYRVALKVMRPDCRDRNRFVQEARATILIDNNRFVSVKHTVLDPKEELPLFTMNYVEGGMSLTDLIDRFDSLPDQLVEHLHGNLRLPGKPALNDRIRLRRRYRDTLLAAVVKHVADGIHILHTEYNRLHCDLKPGNILIDKRHGPLVSDLGLSRSLNRKGKTRPEGFAGTPAYSSPEQAADRAAGTADCEEPLTPRSDVYQLGAVVYRGMTGQAPFMKRSIDETDAETLNRVRSEPLESPRQKGIVSDRKLEAICLKALSRNEKDRYQTADEMAEDLDRFIGGRPVRAGRGAVPFHLVTAIHFCLNSIIFRIIFSLFIIYLICTYLYWRETMEVPGCIASANKYRTKEPIPPPKEFGEFSIAEDGIPKIDNHIKINKLSIFFDLSRWEPIPANKTPQTAGRVEASCGTKVIDLELLDDAPEHAKIRFLTRTEGFDCDLRCTTHPYKIWKSTDRDLLGGGTKPTLITMIEVDLNGIPARHPVRVVIQDTIWNGFQPNVLPDGESRQWAAFLAPNNLPEGELAMKFPEGMKPRGDNEPGLYVFERTAPKDKKQLALGANFYNPRDKPWWVWRPVNVTAGHVYQIEFPWTGRTPPPAGPTEGASR